MINVVNLVQHYGVRPVLRGVNLEIEKGEIGVRTPSQRRESLLRIGGLDQLHPAGHLAQHLAQGGANQRVIVHRDRHHRAADAL